MRKNFYRSKVKTKPINEAFRRKLKGISLLVCSIAILYCILFPAQFGVFSGAISSVLNGYGSSGASHGLFGWAAILLPLLICWQGYVYLKNEFKLHLRIDLFLSALLLLFATSFLDLIGDIKFGKDIEQLGGWIGNASPLFYKVLLNNYYLSLSALFILFVYFGAMLMRISMREVLEALWKNIVLDYHQWVEARGELKKNNSSVPKIFFPNEPNGPKEDTKAPQMILPNIPQLQKKELPRIILPAVKTYDISKKRDEKPKNLQNKPEANAKELELFSNGSTADYILPSVDLLSEVKQDLVAGNSAQDFTKNAQILEKTLENFGISAKVKDIIPGPVVTRYDMELAPGTKIEAVSGLSENIALNMKAVAVRIVAVPEKSAVGVEVPNEKRCIVSFREIVESQDFQNSKSLLTFGLGKTTDGHPSVTDIKIMPHLLIAGATGSGKSVGIHSLILSMLFKAKPDEVKFLLIDPKRVELTCYRGIPHLYDPSVKCTDADIITQPKEAAAALKKLVHVMEKRYEKFAKESVRNIESYNQKMAETGGPKEFYIVIIIDELADLMVVQKKEVEDSIQRLAQMARAVGIHLILATQRPSVDVITGIIKSNLPARIAFQTTSQVDSRVVLDTIGAEDLLGRGDMLFLPSGASRPDRLQGAYVPEKDPNKVVDFILSQNIKPFYEDVLVNAATANSSFDANDNKEIEELVRALKLMQERKRISQDLLKAHFGSSSRATNILSILEMKGFINKPEGTNRWSIDFMRVDEYLKTFANIGDNPNEE